MPSPLTSAAVTDPGALPVAKVCWAANLSVGGEPVVVLSSTDTVLSFPFATIRSGLPSPLTSAAVTEDGALPVAKVCWAAKLSVGGEPVVALSSTDTVLSFPFATIRSGLPSPLRSAAVTEDVALPVAKVRWAAKRGRGRARRGGVEQHRHRVVVLIRHDQIGFAVPINVRRRHRLPRNPPMVKVFEGAKLWVSNWPRRGGRVE